MIDNSKDHTLLEDEIIPMGATSGACDYGSARATIKLMTKCAGRLGENLKEVEKTICQLRANWDELSHLLFEGRTPSLPLMVALSNRINGNLRQLVALGVCLSEEDEKLQQEEAERLADEKAAKNSTRRQRRKEKRKSHDRS